MDKKNADQETKEFVVNDYITLKLENGKTEVYIAGEKFIQCRNIAYNLAVKETVEKIGNNLIWKV